MVSTLWAESSGVGVGRTKVADAMLVLELWRTSLELGAGGTQRAHGETVRRVGIWLSAQTNEMTAPGLDAKTPSTAIIQPLGQNQQYEAYPRPTRKRQRRSFQSASPTSEIQKLRGAQESHIIAGGIISHTLPLHNPHCPEVYSFHKTSIRRTSLSCFLRSVKEIWPSLRIMEMASG